ncbi:hypothetical protein SODALDRAFT_329435 [Sodiomyces alkalinus F11]|uniref:Monopolin complex subunit Csm1/Pcs1 C-terminal domain-containing protein n=1 Tax=Sodiomyces alkalinus (strain CBS 110278 / VKM F-3762 / F11) TaxID=1314773 RepID=A0A3N2PJW4_SODAK|nr:hypothetical protein SODALDRAFT_329435 [Sodiomyces alkalinus F11]ROT34822.1 hypothetical protein SODALDRAFT_329435 [Sodiomyces alkalinus F11]
MRPTDLSSKLSQLKEDLDGDELSLPSFSPGHTLGPDTPGMARKRVRSVVRKVSKPGRHSSGQASKGTGRIRNFSGRSIPEDMNECNTRKGRKPHPAIDLCKGDKEEDMANPKAGASQRHSHGQTMETNHSIPEPQVSPSKSIGMDGLGRTRHAAKYLKAGEASKVFAVQYSTTMDMDDKDELSEETFSRPPPASSGLTAPIVPSSSINMPTSESIRNIGSATLQSQMGELNSIYERLEARYQNLRELGIGEAERNFERLKKQCEEQANAANDLISGLRAELVVQRQLAEEAQQHREHYEDANAQIAELKTSLSEAQEETQVLREKLLAAGSTEIPGIKVSSSGSKRCNDVPRNDSAPAAVYEVHEAQMKDELYGDLTGLVIQNTMRKPSGIAFDCIQRGNIGILRFRLTAGVKGCDTDYEDAQFTYMPQLDAERDKELTSVLPDYLIEDITFPRSQAGKFFSRISQSLNRKQPGA